MSVVNVAQKLYCKYYLQMLERANEALLLRDLIGEMFLEHRLAVQIISFKNLYMRCSASLIIREMQMRMKITVRGRLTTLGMAVVLVCWGCLNHILLGGCINNRNLFSHWRLEIQDKVWSGLVSPLASPVLVDSHCPAPSSYGLSSMCAR